MTLCRILVKLERLLERFFNPDHYAPKHNPVFGGILAMEQSLRRDPCDGQNLKEPNCTAASGYLRLVFGTLQNAAVTSGLVTSLKSARPNIACPYQQYHFLIGSNLRGESCSQIPRKAVRGSRRNSCT